MAVFTPITENLLINLLKAYPLGQLKSFHGIEEGVTNSNFRVITTTGTYIFTIFEELSQEAIPFFIHLNEHLVEAGLPCASTLRDKEGQAIHRVANKPAIFMSFLPGQSRKKVDMKHIAAMGQQLGKMHEATKNYPHYQKNIRGLNWHREAVKRIVPLLNTEDKNLLLEEMTYQGEQDHSKLPQGIIHADFFRDNVFFDGVHLSGLIDFYYACHDVYLLDLAIVANDWCLTEEGIPDLKKVDLLSHSYEEIFPHSKQQWAHWGALLRAAALRFWLSRLLDFHFTPPGEMVPVKNPNEMKKILLFWKENHLHP